MPKKASASAVQNPIYNNFSLTANSNVPTDSSYQNSHSTAVDNPEYLNTNQSPLTKTVFESSPYWIQAGNHQINLDNPDYQQDFLPKETKSNGLLKVPAAENPEYLRVAAPKSEYIEASAWPLRISSCSRASWISELLTAARVDSGSEQIATTMHQKAPLLFSMGLWNCKACLMVVWVFPCPFPCNNRGP